MVFNEEEAYYWIDPETGGIWERSGSCSQCGDCCEDTENIFRDYDGNYDTNNPMTQSIHDKCAYFSKTEDGKGFCNGRNTTYYLSGCNEMPSKPKHIENWPNCTYSFRRIN